MDTHGKRLRLLYPDIHGLERGKYLFGDWASTGMAAFCIGVYPLTHDKEILPIPRTQFDVGLHDVEAHLDRDSLRPGWETNTLIGIADVQTRGEPAPWDARHTLREACRPWQVPILLQIRSGAVAHSGLALQPPTPVKGRGFWLPRHRSPGARRCRRLPPTTRP